MPSVSLTLEPYRKYLTVLAGVHFPSRLRGKLDVADVVQNTLLRAQAALNEAKPVAVAAWLRKILASELADTAKHFDRDKRAIDRERRLEADLDRSAQGFDHWLAADLTSPSGKAVRNEEMLRLADALAELPDAMREVVVLKHSQGWTLARIAERMGKSVPSVASLLRRGLAQLRTRLEGSSHDEAP